MMAGLRLERRDHLAQRDTATGTDVHRLADRRRTVEQPPVDFDDAAHIEELAHDVDVAELDRVRPAPEMADELRDHEMIRLPRASVVERSYDDDRQPTAKRGRHMLHRELARPVVADRRGRR